MDQKLDLELLKHQFQTRDVSNDSLSQSNASVYEPSELGSISSMDDSATDYAGSVPQCFSLKEKYKREFKAAIKDSYKYIMNQDMAESCKFIEEELSALDSDDGHEGHTLSYNEFIRQYKDLKEWLKAICEQITQSSPLCLSEKYLNQAHHEELLQRLIRRTQFDEYATQLIDRYPFLKEDIISKKKNINELWTDLERVVTSNDSGNPLTILEDVELDLSNFESWLIDMNKNLKDIQHRVVSNNTSKEKLIEVIKAQHKEVQPKSKFVNSTLQMCDNLLSSWKTLPLPIENKIIKAKSKARVLQHRWESLFIQIFEWQLRIEEDYNAKHRWSQETNGLPEHQEEINSDFGDAKVLPRIIEDIEEIDHQGINHSHLKYVDGHFVDYANEKSFCIYDVGYSSEGQQSHNSFKFKTILDLKKQSCCCNVGSDLSDSSGIGISIATGSYVGKSRNLTIGIVDSKLSNECLDVKISTEPETSLPVTEDEFSCDDMPFTSTRHPRLTQSMDHLNYVSVYKCPSLPDSTVSDGELLCADHMAGFGVIQGRKLHINKESLRTKSEFPMNESFEVKKCPKKRKFLESGDVNRISNCFKENSLHSKMRKVLSCGNVIELSEKKACNHSKDYFLGMATKGDDQLVPCISVADVANDDLCTGIEISDDELDPSSSLFSKDDSCRHSTPKAFRKFCNSQFIESDSDVEDFKIMMEDSSKALIYTKTSVAKTVKASRRVMDSVEFLEPLATCQTSIKCLKELQEAFNSVKVKKYLTLDIIQLQALLKDWTVLESQILHHLESGRQLILSEVDLLKKQLSHCEDILDSVSMDKVAFNLGVFLNIAHCYKAEKVKLLNIHKNIVELKKSVSPLINKRFPINILSYNDIPFTLEHLGSLCRSLLVRVENLLSSHLEAFEPCMNFCKLAQDVDELLKQSEYCMEVASVRLSEQELITLLSCETKEILLKMTERLNRMDQLLIEMGSAHSIHQFLSKRMEDSRLAIRNFQIKRKSVFESLVLFNKNVASSPEVDNGEASKFDEAMVFTPSFSKLHKFAKKVIRFGLPVSAALLLGWVCSNVGELCKENDWSLMLFPSLQHTRGRPPM